MSIELPRFDLTEPQLRWLRLVYERTVVGKYPKIHIERRLHPDWFPPDFDPGGISNVLVGSDGLTLLGVWHVDPDNMLFRRLDAVIHAIKQRIASDPAARVVTASSLAEELDESEPSIVEALGYINHAGARWSSASGASSPGRGYTQITLSNEDDFRAFERYETLEQGVRQHLQDVEAQRQRAILKSRSRQPLIPPAIQHSLENFRRDYRDPARTAFIMMKFGTTLGGCAVENF